MLAAAIRLGGDRVESGQCVRTPGAAQSAGWRLERNHVELPGNADKLHSAGLHAIRDGGLAISAGVVRDKRGDAILCEVVGLRDRGGRVCGRYGAVRAATA